MQHSPSWAANRFAASQEIPRISRNPKVHYRTHNHPPPVCIPGQPNTVHIPTSHRSILILSTHLRLGLPSGLLPSGFPTETLYTPLSSPIRTTCPAHLSLTYLLTYSLTPRCRVLLEKLTGLQLVKKFPAIYGTWRFITAFASARQLSLSWASSIQSIPAHNHFLKIHLNILPSTPGSPKWSLSLGFTHQNPVCTFPIPHKWYMPCPSHSSPHLVYSTPLLTSSLLGPNIFLKNP